MESNYNKMKMGIIKHGFKNRTRSAGHNSDLVQSISPEIG